MSNSHPLPEGESCVSLVREPLESSGRRNGGPPGRSGAIAAAGAVGPRRRPAPATLRGVEVSQPTISHHSRRAERRGFADLRRRASWVRRRNVPEALTVLSPPACTMPHLALKFPAHLAFVTAPRPRWWWAKPLTGPLLQWIGSAMAAGRAYFLKPVDFACNKRPVAPASGRFAADRARPAGIMISGAGLRCATTA